MEPPSQSERFSAELVNEERGLKFSALGSKIVTDALALWHKSGFRAVRGISIVKSD